MNLESWRKQGGTLLDLTWCVEEITKQTWLNAGMCYRGVISCPKLGGNVVMRRTTAARRHFYSAKAWVGNYPTCPPDTYAPVNYVVRPTLKLVWPHLVPVYVLLLRVIQKWRPILGEGNEARDIKDRILPQNHCCDMIFWLSNVVTVWVFHVNWL